MSTPAGDAVDVARAFEETPAILWAFEGPEHRVVAANRAARASSGDRPKMFGRPVREVLPELEGQQIFETMDAVFAEGTPVAGHERQVLVDRDGDGRLTENFYTYSFLPTRHADGTVRGIVVHAVESTEQVRARQLAENRAAESEQRYHAAQDVVLRLQRSLLPDGLPVLPGLRVAARYLVAGRELDAGGDWFDVVPLSDGTVALMVGDVVGHGAAAAAAMGQLRTVAREALLAGVGLGRTLARLDAFAAGQPATRGATACLVLVDPVDGRLRVASHAHPAPLVVGADGATRFLPVRPVAPLGTGSAAAEPTIAGLAAGELVLLYSDGLVERSGQTLRHGMDDLARVASAALRHPVEADTTTAPASVPDRICALSLERLSWSGGGYTDDVTLLVAQRVAGPPPVLHLQTSARVGALAVVRRAVCSWLAGFDPAPDDVVALVHAVIEALTNVVEHAYPDGTGPVLVHGELDRQGVATVVVSDRGRWRPPDVDPGHRGRGLMMMRGLVRGVEVTPSAAGTTVTLRHPLCRPAVVGMAPGGPLPAKRPAELDFGTELTPSASPVLTVRGPIDVSTVDLLRRRILEASRGGALPLTLDLAAVTQLSSAGVQLLHELSTTGTGLRLAASARQPTRQVLTLTGLDALLDDEPVAAAGSS